jgi:hypothetical protein
MSLPSFDEVVDQAADEPAFSNGTEGDAWMENWCYRCRHEETCPLIEAAMVGMTPAQWQEQDRFSLGSQYRCTEFEAAS